MEVGAPLEASSEPADHQEVIIMPSNAFYSELKAADTFLQYVAESPFMWKLPHIKQVVDEVALVKALLIHRPRRFVEDSKLTMEIENLAQRMVRIISSYDLQSLKLDTARALERMKQNLRLTMEIKDLARRMVRIMPSDDQERMKQEMAREVERMKQDMARDRETMKVEQDMAARLVKRLKFTLVLKSYWMELVRLMISGEEPRVHSVDSVTPLDAVLDFLRESRFSLPMQGKLVKRVALLRAILMDPDPPQASIENGTLKELEAKAKEVASIMSFFDLHSMDQSMAYELNGLLRLCFIFDDFAHPSKPLRELVKPARMVYAGRPKPLRMYHPRTFQLGFVDHLVDNLRDLLLKAKVDSFICLLQFDILEFQEELQLVSCQFMDIPEQRKEEADLKDLMSNITNLAYEAEYVIDSFLIRDIPIWYCMFWLREIQKELKHQEGLIKMAFGDRKSIISNIVDIAFGEHKIVAIVNRNTEMVETLGEVFKDIFLRNYYAVRTRALVSSYAERKEIMLQELLLNVLSRGELECGDLKSDEINRISDMSENELEESVYNLLVDKSYFVILEDVQNIHDLNAIRRVLPNNQQNENVLLLTTPSPELVVQCRYDFNKMSEHLTSTSQTNKLAIENDVVGFVEEMERMLAYLTEGSTKLCIISIVGMAGQGKTTLAKKLYAHPIVNDHFDTRVWCCVSQVYEKRELLLELLGQLVQDSAIFHRKTNEELAHMLYRHLKGWRYIVFLDDIWRTDAWDDLARCFPDDKNGSRIVFTTRIQGLVSRTKSGSILQRLNPLSDEESWELLEKKVFQKESCPPELLGVGREIAKECQGLPLSVVLTAGLLAKMEKTVRQWEHIAKALNSHILNDVEVQGKSIIELSYNHLPDFLKPCFLYFGAFLKGSEIPVSKLTRLWIAEGFIKHTMLKSLEDVSEDYLRDLAERSLVIVAQQKSNGGVKSCRVHDLLREFCLSKAKEENFLQHISRYNEQFHPIDDNNLDYSLDPNYSCSPTPIIYHLRRVSLYVKRDHLIILKPSGPFVRTLLLFTASDVGPSYSYDVSFIFHNFKLLRILDLEDINVGNCFKVIDMLVLLRYLAVQAYLDLIPSSIANLWNLQTLIVKGLGCKVVKVPGSIWDMSKLRHVQINDAATFDLEPHRLDNSSMPDNLQTISTPFLAFGDDMEKMFRKLKGIQRLKCIFLDSWDEATNCNRLPELGFLNQLVSLKVSYNGEWKYPCEFRFPSNLKKLTLSNFRMPWSEISQLTTLRNMEVLKLLDNAFQGERWEMEDEVFPKLKFLKLDTLDIIEWSATSDHFPRLERLLLHKCEQLEEIPPSMGDILTLQMIEMMWCNPSAAISAKRIQEEQLEFSNEGLNIYVYPKVWDLE